MAYDQMKGPVFSGDQKHKPKWPGLAQPKALTVYAKDDKLYISTTVKLGDGGTSNLQSVAYSHLANPFLPTQLVRCQMMLNSENRHRTHANCAEPMAANLYWHVNPSAPANLQGGKIVTWGWIKKQPDGIKPPCQVDLTLPDDIPPSPDGDPDPEIVWGCQTFMNELLPTIIPDTTAIADPPSDLHLEPQTYCLMPDTSSS